jgi:dihydroxyacetone kinase-like protein
LEASSVPTDVITANLLLKIMKNTLEVMKANEKYLTRLDAEIGDADHGINMVRGFSLVNNRLSPLTNPDIGIILNTVGMALLETVGGAAGPLYGMLYIKGSQPVRGKTEINKKDLAALLEAGLIGVQTIGGGTIPGEKTMVDALDPAVKVLKESTNNDDITFMMALEKATEVAREGMKKTIPLIAKRGRASYLGERSMGHQDPGATSAYLILQTMLDALNDKVGLKVTKYGTDGAIIEEMYI